MISRVANKSANGSRQPPKALFSKEHMWEDKVNLSMINEWRRIDRNTGNLAVSYGNRWRFFNSDLLHYACGQLVEPGGKKKLDSFLDYINALVAVEKSPAMLDVGGGGFCGWEEYLKNNPLVKFSGTAFTKDKVTPEIRPFVKSATAGGLWRHFDRASFDLICTHWGAYSQHMKLIENAMALLKIGGDLILTSKITFFVYPILESALSKHDNRILKVLSSEDENFLETTDPYTVEKYCRTFEYTLQIRKLAKP